MRVYLVLVVAIILSSSVSCSGPRQEIPPEPPLECTYDRGAWCLTGGNPQVQTNIDVEGSTLWPFERSYWTEGAGFILEPATCSVAKSNRTEVLETNQPYSFDGKKWNTVVVRLNDDGLCDLRLIVPQTETGSSAVQRMLPTVIAICTEKMRCSNNLLASKNIPIFD